MAEKTSVPEPNSEINKLVYVIRDDGSYGGWRTELLVKDVTEDGEGFLLCNYCGGMLRDACLFEKDGKHKVACSVCIPKDVNKQIAQLNREAVNEKQVYCPLKSKGCGWTNELGELLHHLQHCELYSVPCPYFQYGCEKAKVPKRIVEQHERENVHKHPKLAVKEKKFQSILTIIVIIAIIVVIIIIIIMIKMIKENEGCPLQETECPYSQYGCEDKYMRRNSEQHEKEDIHNYLNLTLTNIQGEVIKLQKANEESKSNEFKPQSRVVKLEKKNEELIAKIVNLEKKNEEFRSSLQEGKEDMHKQMELAVIKEIDQLKKFQSLLIPMVSSLGAKGNLEWKISGVKNKISQKENTSSDPFYVGLYKFRGCVGWVHNDNYVGLFLYIMKGEWDDTLKWPIRYKYSVVLIKQLDGEDFYEMLFNAEHNYEKNSEITEEDLKKFPQCFKQPSAEGNLGCGLPEFISHTNLLQEKYSKDDSIILKISLEVILDAN